MNLYKAIYVYKNSKSWEKKTKKTNNFLKKGDNRNLDVGIDKPHMKTLTLVKPVGDVKNLRTKEPARNQN